MVSWQGELSHRALATITHSEGLPGTFRTPDSCKDLQCIMPPVGIERLPMRKRSENGWNVPIPHGISGAKGATPRVTSTAGF